jgi:hypothetical protein
MMVPFAALLIPFFWWFPVKHCFRYQHRCHYHLLN